MKESLFINKKYAAIYILFGILLFIPLIIRQPYYLHIFIITFYIGTCTLAWNILGGFTGLFSLGHAVFMALGAYSSTLLLIKLNISPWIGMFVGAAFTGLLSVLIFYPCFVLKGPYFTLATIAIGETFRNLFTNWEVVGKAQGILLPLGDSFWFMQFAGKGPYYYISLFMFIGLFLFVVKLNKSKLGYALKTIREDDNTADAIGINLTKHKLIATFLSAFFTAVAGGFYAQYLRYIDPDIMLNHYSVEMVLPSIIGGIGTVIGPVIGAFILVPLGEWLRTVIGSDLPGASLMVYAIVLIVVMRLQPNGIMGYIHSDNIIKRLKGKEKKAGEEV